MTDPDPRIEAAAKVIAPTFTHHPESDTETCGICRNIAANALAAADAVDPLRVSLPPNSRQTNRAGVAPAGMPTKRIWPER